MYRDIRLWSLPIEQLRSKVDFVCEMSNYDHAFLCGMIREKNPKKILEIGIAEGGTTAVIINTLSLLGGKREIYSVDLSIMLYCDKEKRTGYEYEKMASYIDKTNITHQVLLGATIAKQIDKIGNEIDFVILDTTHQLPGEILDFLSILPYLSKRATIVLHDVNLNYVRAISGNRKLIARSPRCNATKLLFSTVTADKYMSMIENDLPNIAAFTTSEDTYKHITDVFYLLSLTWTYIPDEGMLEDYRNIYKKYYDKRNLELYDIAVKNNQKIFQRMELARNIQEEDINKYRFPYNIVPPGSPIILYGAGLVGKETYKAQKSRGIYDIVLWVDKKYKEYIQEGLEVENPEKIVHFEFEYIVVAVENEDTFQAIYQEIVLHGWNNGKPIIGPMSEY